MKFTSITLYDASPVPRFAPVTFDCTGDAADAPLDAIRGIKDAVDAEITGFVLYDAGSNEAERAIVYQRWRKNMLDSTLGFDDEEDDEDEGCDCDICTTEACNMAGSILTPDRPFVFPPRHPGEDVGWNEQPVEKPKADCPECYGTGYHKGFGGPCSKGCPRL